MMMVPIIVVMGGTFAFSAWTSGSAAVFNQTTATFSYSQELSFISTNANMTPIGISGVNTLTGVTYMTPSQAIDPTQTGTSSTSVIQYANTTNLVPGTWVEFQVTITNTGTATINMSSVTVYNADGQAVQITTGSGSTINGPSSGQTVNMSSAFLPAISLQDALNYAATIPGSLGFIGGALPGSTTVPQYILPGGSFTYVGYIVVGAHDTYTHFGVGIQLNLSTVV